MAALNNYDEDDEYETSTEDPNMSRAEFFNKVAKKWDRSTSPDAADILVLLDLANTYKNALLDIKEELETATSRSSAYISDVVDEALNSWPGEE